MSIYNNSSTYAAKKNINKGGIKIKAGDTYEVEHNVAVFNSKTTQLVKISDGIALYYNSLKELEKEWVDTYGGGYKSQIEF